MQHLKLEGQEERNEKRWSLQALQVYNSIDFCPIIYYNDSST